MKYFVRLAITIFFFFSACVVGPDYKRPTYEVDSWITPQGQEPLDPAWWTIFNDPVLNQLVSDITASNLDLKIAQSRLWEARAQEGVTKASLKPTFGNHTTYTAQQHSLHGTGAADRRTEFYDVGFDASWELDLFGGKRRGNEAAAARVNAALASRRDVTITVIAELARNYVELRGNQKRLRLLEKNIETQVKTLELVKKKVNFGLAREVDLTRSNAQLERTRALLPNLQAEVSNASYRIDTLAGWQPGTFYPTMSGTVPLPAPPEVVPVGLRSDLLRRRPDIQRAERELAESSANIGVAVAKLYPSFSLTGSAGFQAASSLGDLFQSASGFWLFRPSIHIPIFEAGRLRANIRVAEARESQAALQYEQIILNALRETESALINYAKEQETRVAYMKSVAASKHSFELTRQLYQTGLTDFLDVLTAQQNLIATQDQLAQSETRALSHLIALYKSLGGGWEIVEETIDNFKKQEQENYVP